MAKHGGGRRPREDNGGLFFFALACVALACVALRVAEAIR